MLSAPISVPNRYPAPATEKVVGGLRCRLVSGNAFAARESRKVGPGTRDVGMLLECLLITRGRHGA